MKIKTTITKSIVVMGLLTSIGITNANANTINNCNLKGGLTISVKAGTKLINILNNVAETCKYTIVYSNKDTYETVKNKELYSLNIYHKNFNKLLNILLHKNNLNYKIEDNVITVSKIITKTFKVDFIDMIRTGKSNANISISASSSGGSGSGSASSGGGGGTGSSGANIKTEEEVDFWGKLEKNIEQIIVRPEDQEQTKVLPVINRKAGLITLSGTYKQLKRVKKYLNTLLNTAQKEVMISVKVIAVDLNQKNESGIDWSKFGLGINYNTQRGKTDKKNVNINGSDIYTATLSPATDLVTSSLNVANTISDFSLSMAGMVNFLNNYGDSKTLASPNVLALNNQPTLISVGDNINYLIKSSTATSTATSTVGGESETPSSLFVGVLLDITPHVGKNNRITLKINPSISELKYAEDGVRQSAARNLPPDTTTRRLSTVINIADGQTFVLGGLINQKNSNNKNNVDSISNIPILGNLFKSKKITVQRTELVFIITAKIVNKYKPLTLKQNGYEEIRKNYKNGKLIIKRETKSKIKMTPKEKKEKITVIKYKKNQKNIEQKKIKEVNKNSPFKDFN